MMKKIGLVRDPLYRKHKNGEGHPERPERLDAVDDAIDAATPTVEAAGSSFVELSPRDASREEIERVHRPEHFDRIRASAGQPLTRFDMDTSAMEHSFDAAVRAAGGGLSALEAIDAGEVDTAFLFSRPPGHHAESDRAMGFCLFNTAAVAAAHAIEALGMERVLLFDWDVHHGNGSMHSFYERKDVLYASVHQYPHYPGTGRSEEIGSGAGRGYTLNVPFPGGQTDDDYAAVMRELLVPIAADYDPELVIVSAGFDAHGNDPLASMNLTFDGYARMTAAVSSIVAKRPETALLFVLEGGYNLTGLAEGIRAVLEGLARGPSGDWDRGSAAPTAEKAIQAARMSLSDFFPSLLG